MHTDKIFDENGQGFTRVFSTDKVEKVNPIEFYKAAELEKRAIVLHDLLSAKDPFLASTVSKAIYIKNAKVDLDEFFETFEKTEVNGNLIELLKTILIELLCIHKSILFSVKSNNFEDA